MIMKVPLNPIPINGLKEDVTEERGVNILQKAFTLLIWKWKHAPSCLTGKIFTVFYRLIF